MGGLFLLIFLDIHLQNVGIQYIHGTQPSSYYLALDPSYKNPADTAETNGLRMLMDTTATWNSGMRRSELIPQTTANLGTGNLFYHFSIKTDAAGFPNVSARK